MIGDRLIKVKCNDKNFGFEIDFFIYQEVIGDEGGKQLKIANFDDSGILVFKSHIWGAIATPTFTLSHDVAKQLASALNEFNIKPDEESKVRGLYEASQKHLEDMRKLVFKRK